MSPHNASAKTVNSQRDSISRWSLARYLGEVLSWRTVQLLILKVVSSSLRLGIEIILKNKKLRRR